jgi:hypothetical protein
VGVNIADSWLHEAATALRCRVGKVPFLYLGLPIGGGSCCLSFWDPVLTRIKNILSGWKSRFLSFGGRLILVKSVLTSLPDTNPSGGKCGQLTPLVFIFFNQ